MTEGLELEPIWWQVRDQVYEKLRRSILEGLLKPSERLVERKLAEQMKVSRTPVREAIRMLELEGLVYHIPRVGAIVVQLNDAEVLEVYRIRAVLEGLAARMAAEKIETAQLNKIKNLLVEMEEYATKDDILGMEAAHREFNDLIYKAADSPRLYAMINTLVDTITNSVKVGYSYPGRVAEAMKEHRQLVGALRLQDGDLAERTAREHIENSRLAYFKEMAHRVEHEQ